MLRKIKLYGQLAKFVGHRVLEADVETAAEAVRFLLANWPELEKHMADQHYKVSVGEYDIDKEELHYPVGQNEISFVPVVSGAGAVGRIIAGALLITAAVLAAAGTFGASLAVGGSFYFATAAVGYIGAALFFGGISELLLKQSDEEDPRRSYSFSGIQNTSRVGTPVPIVYGEVVVGSVITSAGIDIDFIPSLTLQPATIGPIEDTGLDDTFEPVSGNLTASGGTDTLTYSLVDDGIGDYGTLTVAPNGTYTYTPNATAINALGPGDYTDTFTVRVTDGKSTSTATFTVNVKGATETGYKLTTKEYTFGSPSDVEVTWALYTSSSGIYPLDAPGVFEYVNTIDCLTNQPTGQGFAYQVSSTRKSTALNVRSLRIVEIDYTFTLVCGSDNGPLITYGVYFYSDTSFTNLITSYQGTARATFAGNTNYSNKSDLNSFKMIGLSVNGVVQPIA